MIRVTRDATNRPRGFQTRAQRWRKQFREARARDAGLSASRFWSAVRPALRADAAALAGVFRDKCAFCESRMAHVQHPHIEHYRPKGRREFEKRMFDWDNWLHSCGRCNESKWTHFPISDEGDPCLLDPTADDPDAHLGFVHEHITWTTNRGEETVRLLGLARTPLEDERAQWLMTINLLLLLAVPPTSLREARDLLVWCAGDSAPWTACVRSYLQTKAPKLLFAAPVVIQGDPQRRIHDLIESQTGVLALLE